METHRSGTTGPRKEAGFFYFDFKFEISESKKKKNVKNGEEECPPRSAGTTNRAANPDLIQPVNICLSGGLMNVTADVNLGMK